MRMFRTLFVSAALLAATPLVVAAPAVSAATYDIDNSHTSVLFKVSHLGIAPFYGRFNKVSGSFDYDAASPGASKLNVEIDVNSVFSADKKRDDHLKAPDFFNAKQFPTITLKSTRVAAGKRAGTLTITADLTLRGVTKSVTFDVAKTGEGKDPWGGERVGFEGELTIDRLDYGVSYMPEGLGKNVTIIIAVEGVKKK